MFVAQFRLGFSDYREILPSKSSHIEKRETNTVAKACGRYHRCSVLRSMTASPRSRLCAVCPGSGLPYVLVLEESGSFQRFHTFFLSLGEKGFTLARADLVFGKAAICVVLLNAITCLQSALRSDAAST